AGRGAWRVATRRRFWRSTAHWGENLAWLGPLGQVAGFGRSRGAPWVRRIARRRHPGSNARPQAIHGLLAPHPRTTASSGTPGSRLRPEHATASGRSPGGMHATTQAIAPRFGRLACPCRGEYAAQLHDRNRPGPRSGDSHGHRRGYARRDPQTPETAMSPSPARSPRARKSPARPDTTAPARRTRVEHDSMGELQVPADALWGAQ